MLSYTNRSNDYFALAIEIHSALDLPSHLVYNKNILNANKGLAGRIASALERMTPNDKLQRFAKSVQDYSNQIVSTMQKDFDILKKDIALGHETIVPLLKVNDMFQAIYGNETAQKLIVNTPVIYYQNINTGKDTINGSYPFLVMEEISKVFDDHDKLYKTMMHFFNVDRYNGEIDMPKINTSAGLPKNATSLSELGYNYDMVKTGVDKVLSSGLHVKLANRSQEVMKTANILKNGLYETTGFLKDFNKDFQNQIQNIEISLSTLQNQMVALSTIIVLSHAVMFSAYNTAFTIHKAEIDFNKSQINKR